MIRKQRMKEKEKSKPDLFQGSILIYFWYDLSRKICTQLIVRNAARMKHKNIKMIRVPSLSGWLNEKEKEKKEERKT